MAKYVGCLLALCAIVACVLWQMGILSKEEEQKLPEKEVEIKPIDPKLYAQDSIRALQVDSLVKHFAALDTTRLGLKVFDITTRRSVYGYHENDTLIPASCMKLATAIAAYKTLGSDHTYETTLRYRGQMSKDTLVGELLLQGDDDPTVLNIDTLTDMMYKNGIHAIRGILSCDLAREDTLKRHPSTTVGDILLNDVPVLLRGKAHALKELEGALSRKGILFKHDENVKPANTWREVARVDTKLTDVLTPMLMFSRNILAESVLFHLDAHEGLTKERCLQWNIFHSVQNFWEKNLTAQHNLDRMFKSKLETCVMNDGSGLSYDNRLTANVIVDMLWLAWKDEALRNYLIDEALPAPGDTIRNGSLRMRMSTPEFQGRVFAKTGTLVSRGVSSLAGFIHGADDHWYVFSILNQNCPVEEGRIFQDAFCKIFVK